jgi:hypothetical protein
MIANGEMLYPSVQPTTSRLGWPERWDHVLARVGVRRMQHRVAPGLYALGAPGPDAPVFVSANYTLSFDALREALPGVDGYILVIDTQGVNVWCAAGEGTFGTDELVARVQATGLKDVVRTRTLILPQLGAPGVSAQEVHQRSGFAVAYGPVRARDLPAYLRTRQATPAMRRVGFPLRDRLTVALVDLTPALLPMLIAAVVLFFLGGAWLAGAAVAATLGGVLVFPALLPWLPTKDFSSKGLILGLVLALPFALGFALVQPRLGVPLQAVRFSAVELVFAPVTAFLALLFTGSTTFTSRSGVKREMAYYIPRMAWMFGIGLVLMLAGSLLKGLGGL